ncbi:Leucine-rich repeat receptor-like protein kinase [Arachis hypogaea]|nr:Leucine-rich repeat receptor-like protein kinase [Arachis hypogaea]
MPFVTMRMSSVTLFLILCFSTSLYDASALASDGVTLLSLLTHWTFVPPIINSTWKGSDSVPCSWIGVQCNHAYNVISLNLSDLGIQGQLGPEIGQLYRLQTLVLSNNGFLGEVPSKLSNCTLLQVLDLSNNSFSGLIPNIFKKLQSLRSMNLSSNLLGGTIPDSLFQIRQLEEMNLHNNHLSGPIPSSIGNLTELLRLHLHGNQLSGTIPSSIGNCSKLEELFLNENRLNGELSLEMAKLKNLKTMSLFDNQFSGVIPQDLGINSSIVKLDFTNNKFTGNLPPSLCFRKKLQVLNMGSNRLQGNIPSDVGRCTSLSMLILSENNFIGSLPVFESNMNLKYLHISKNNISGPIPPSLENCTNLAAINMSLNKFTGLIPSALGKLVNLTILDLSHNNLEGPLPPQLSNCTKMDHFDVGFNSLNGSFPSSLRNWTGITTLILRENHFTGGIPSFFSELSKLRELQLGGNLIGGTIPPSLGKLQNLFYGLNLSCNGLTGVIPLELGHVQELQSLDLSLNNLTGNIDVLDKLLSLIEINISNNFLHGPIPKSLFKFLNSSSSSFLGNPHLCVSCSPSSGLNCTNTSNLKPCPYQSTDHKGISALVILMIELASSLFVSAMLVALLLMYLRKKEMKNDVYGEKWLSVIKFFTENQSASLHDIVMEATDNLNDQYIIGRGAHGIVYRAQLGDTTSAVKKIAFERNKRKYLHIMRKEIEVLGGIKHRNLVSCADYWIGENYGLVLYKNLAIHSYSQSQSCKKLSTYVVGTAGYIAPENAYVIVQSRKSDVYSYGVVLLELLTRKRVVVEEERKVTGLVSWVRSIWLETGKIEEIVDPDLANAFPSSGRLACQVTKVLLLALRCTERKPRKRPTMKDIVGFYQQEIFKLSCDDVDMANEDVVDVAPQPYSVPFFSTNPFSDTQCDSYMHGETSEAAMLRHNKFALYVDNEPQDSNGFSWWQDFSQSQNSLVDWNVMATTKTAVDGFTVKLIGNGKIYTEQVVVTALFVHKVTYTWPYLFFLPTVNGPVVTQPFNWFFLSCLTQYMYQQKSLKSQLKSCFIAPINDSSSCVIVCNNGVNGR